MKASEVNSHNKTLAHHHGDLKIKAYTKEGLLRDVEPKTIQFVDGSEPFILITAPMEGENQKQ
jgi:hypothetical protein